MDPRRLHGVLVSHAHPDHYTDAEVLVEAMTAGALKRQGVLAGSKNVLAGEDIAISKYHQRLPREVVEASAGTQFKVGRLEVTGCEARHVDANCVGFRFKTDFGDLAYTSDTGYFDEIGGWYEGVRVLILCVLRPSGEPWQGHLSTSEAVRIVDKVKPELVILTHFGMKMIRRGPAEEARRTENTTGVETIAAWDGMEVSATTTGFRFGTATEGRGAC